MKLLSLFNASFELAGESEPPILFANHLIVAKATEEVIRHQTVNANFVAKGNVQIRVANGSNEPRADVEI